MYKTVYFKEYLENNPDNKTRVFIDAGWLNNDFCLHVHDFYELVVILDGKAIHEVDGVEYAISRGDVFVINGDVPHGFKNVNKLEFYNIVFRLEDLYISSAGLRKLPGFQALFILEPFYNNEKTFSSSLNLNSAKLIYVSSIINEILLEQKEKEACHEVVVENYFKSLILFLSREYSRSKKTSNIKILPLAEAVAFMERNYAQTIKLKQLSEMVHFSAPYFIKEFKKVYGVTPINFLTQLRIGHACSLLKTSNLSILAIAQECGFEDSNYFCRIFRKLNGKSPKVYRKDMKGTL